MAAKPGRGRGAPVADDLRFCDRDFWTASYAQSSTFKDFEWYLPVEAYTAILMSLLKGDEGARILNVGCGTSSLPLSLWAAGVRNVTSIDISAACVADMKKRAAKKPGLVFSVDDALALSCTDGSFDVVLDKATSDVFMAEKDASVRVANVTRMFAEASRVLRPGGLLVVITRHRPTKYAPIFEGLGWCATHSSIPAPRVYHGKVHVYVVVKGAPRAKETRAALERLRTAAALVPLSRADLEAEDSGGSDDDSDDDDESFDGEDDDDEEDEEEEDSDSNEDDEDMRVCVPVA
jgi:SAM-dependent methyltransferase